MDGLTVLHIEDNAIDRMIVREIFAEHAPSVRIVGAGTAAQAMALSHEGIDVVLLDLHLPDATGAQLLRRLELPGVPVIVLSADDRQATRWELHEAGAYGYLTKPIDVAKLLTIVTTARVEVAA